MTDDVRLIEVKQEIFADNKAVADELRHQLTAEKTFLVNLMSSPGAGKTSLILETIEELKGQLRLGVIEADIDSTVDSEKVAARGINAIQLRTGGFCHLDASMVKKGLEAMDLRTLDVVIIENVGNLVCPAEFDTGAIRNVMILSIPEGDDKPLKYPLMFSVCDLLLLNKMDYLEHSDFDKQALRKRVLSLNSRMKILEVSCKTGQGIPTWTDWLREEFNAFTRS